MTGPEKPGCLDIELTVRAEVVREMGGCFVALTLPAGVPASMLNREQAKALAAFLAHWSDSASAMGEYFEGEELAGLIAPLAPWLQAGER